MTGGVSVVADRLAGFGYDVVAWSAAILSLERDGERVLLRCMSEQSWRETTAALDTGRGVDVDVRPDGREYRGTFAGRPWTVRVVREHP